MICIGGKFIYFNSIKIKSPNSIEFWFHLFTPTTPRCCYFNYERFTRFFLNKNKVFFVEFRYTFPYHPFLTRFFFVSLHGKSKCFSNAYVSIIIKIDFAFERIKENGNKKLTLALFSLNYWSHSLPIETSVYESMWKNSAVTVIEHEYSSYLLFFHKGNEWYKVVNRNAAIRYYETSVVFFSSMTCNIIKNTVL